MWIWIVIAVVVVGLALISRLVGNRPMDREMGDVNKAHLYDQSTRFKGGSGGLGPF